MSSDVEVLGDAEGEMEDLQRALALSMQEYTAAVAGVSGNGGSPAAAGRAPQGPAAGAAQQQQQQQQQEQQDQDPELGHEGPKKCVRRQPMRGKRKQAEQAQAEQHAEQEQAQQQEQEKQQEQEQEQRKQQQLRRQQQAQALKRQAKQQPRRQPRREGEDDEEEDGDEDGEEQQGGQTPSASGAAASQPAGASSRAKPAAPAAAPTAAAAKPRQPRKKKLPAFNPSAAEVEACFAALAAGNNMVTVRSIVEVSQATGGGLDLPAVKGMMAYAAEKVLGWGSTAGRQGTGGTLGLAAFHRLIDHFRVV